MLERAGDPRRTTAEWWQVAEQKEHAASEAAERAEAELRERAKDRTNADWHEQWEREAAQRAARARP
jgi:hypothetical protein